MTDLRELVDMLPGEMRNAIYANEVENDENHILGYLVRWLGERGWWLMKNKIVFWTAGDDKQRIVGATPLEAAVRAVGAVENSK